MVAHLNGVQGGVGSNPTSPIMTKELKPGDVGYKPQWCYAFSIEKTWYVERRDYDRVYEPGDCVEGTCVSFGFDRDDDVAALSHLHAYAESCWELLEGVTLVSKRPWKEVVGG